MQPTLLGLVPDGFANQRSRLGAFQHLSHLMQCCTHKTVDPATGAPLCPPVHSDPDLQHTQSSGRLCWPT
eukprot:4651413-Amphidinium_carterae.1